jgi:hypothetical protein
VKIMLNFGSGGLSIEVDVSVIAMLVWLLMS